MSLTKCKGTFRNKLPAIRLLEMKELDQITKHKYEDWKNK